MCSGIESSSVQLVEAAKWTLKQLNEQGYLPGFTLGIRVTPTCHVAGKAVENTVKFLNNIEAEIGNSSIISLLGPEFSSEAANTSSFISSLPENKHIPQFIFSATAESLSDQAKYGNIKRVVPSDNLQVKTIISLLLKVEWNYVAVLYLDDTYGKGAFQEFQIIARTHDICIPYHKSLSVGTYGELNPTEITDSLDTIINYPESPIHGVVVFSSSKTARDILRSAEIRRRQNTFQLAFVFSDGVGLNLQTFSDNDQIIDIAKGSFIASPPIINFPNFTSHWNDIFNNKQTLDTESKTNPWLLEVFKDFNLCSPSGSIDDCTITESGRLRAIYQSKYVGYTILSVITIAKLMKETHGRTCSSNGICPELQTLMENNKGFLTSISDDLKVNLGEEFPSFGVEKNFSLSFATDIQHSSTGSDYDIFQFGECTSSTDSYCIEKVGSFKNNSFEFDQGKSIHPVLKAQCDMDRTCVQCSNSHLYDAVYVEPGDLYVVGLAPVYDKSTDNPMACTNIRQRLGVELIEAMAFAVKTINERQGEYSNYFPGKKIGFILLNPCDQPLRGQNLLVSMLEKGIKLLNESTIYVHDKILGFVAGYTSIMSQYTSLVLTPYRYVQIAYASLAAFLSDRTTYPYFLRVGTPENNLANSVVRLVKSLDDSNFIQILYSEGVYGEGGRDAILREAKALKVCVTATYKVIEGGQHSKILPDLRRNSYAKIVIVIVHSFVLLDMINAIYDDLEPGEFIFIASAAWSDRLELIMSRPKFAGFFSYAMEIPAKPTFIDYLNEKVFLTDKNPWLIKYVEEKNTCYLPGSFSKKGKQPCGNLTLAPVGSELELWTMFAMTAMFSLLGGTNEVFQSLCGSQTDRICADYMARPEVVYESIKKQTAVIGDSEGPTRTFDDNGDGMVGAVIYQVWKSPDDPTKLIYGRVGKAKPGEGGHDVNTKLFQFPNGDPKSVCPDPRSCAKCFDDQQNNTGQSDKKTEEDTSSIIALATVVPILAVAVIVLSIVLFCKYRKEKCTDKTYDEAYLHPIPDNYDRPPQGYNPQGNIGQQQHNYVLQNLQHENFPQQQQGNMAHTQQQSNMEEAPQQDRVLRHPQDNMGQYVQQERIQSYDRIH
ncbi:hypothetical protein FSP39_008773 [Pinctada imbricata]|uniref:Receptor ligand binding region domain-containing protein n=1 Tax=Pinctada imbricata TaxID=66713 RepID=A0AA88XI71_PINIB|nr:hypothetical protein FSP39_008773 [Pinctada imbricata]